jgi:Flp pilus assembly pilin Flp
MPRIMNFIRNNTGAAGVEYTILVGLIAGVILVAVSGLGQGLGTLFSNFVSQWPDIP